MQFDFLCDAHMFFSSLLRYGWISSWMHVKCVRLEDPASLDVEKHIAGLEALTDEEQNMVCSNVDPPRL